MNAIFYHNNSDEKKVNKSLSLITNVPCRIKEGTTMRTPTIILSKDSLPNWNAINYMYLDTFGRYYFIEPSNIHALTGGEIAVGGRIDPLQSNVNGILNITCLVTRQENNYNMYMIDDVIIGDVNKTVEVQGIGSISDESTFIIGVDGGER